MPRNWLSDSAIEQIMEIPSGSEDDLDFSEAESDDDLARIRQQLTEQHQESDETVSELNQSKEVENQTGKKQIDSKSSQPSTSTSFVPTVLSETTRDSIAAQTRTRTHATGVSTATRTKKRNYVWKKKPFQVESLSFTGNTTLESPFIDYETPFQFFSHFFDYNLLEHIIEETTKFSIQKDPAKPFKIRIDELQKYLGICLIMGLAPLPNIRMYWQCELGVPLIKETMSLNHFEKIRQFLHFNDNSTQPPRGSPGHDRLHKIRPILETLKKKCQSVSKREALSVDEQMCATKASNMLRQYLPNKPHKWGYKLLVLCDDRGFAYDFEVYSGMENDPELRLAGEPDLGASANIVVRLARTIPRNEQYRLYFDNYYTSPELISYLAKEGILSLGTINIGRLGKNMKVPSLKDLKSSKKERGFSEEWVADVDGIEIATVVWFDNKPVVLSSSFAGKEPTQKVRRFCKKQKKYIEVDCPEIVNVYNRHMGGVDLLDSFLGKYKIKMRTRKWYLRLFYHFLDVIVINSWLLFKRCGEEKGEPTLMKLRDFKLEIAKCLCLSGPSISRKRGRPSSVDNVIEMKRIKKNTAILPPRDVRRDGFEHFPIWNSKRQRCKYPQCKGKTFVSCEKCKVELCFNKDNNCFRNFHM